MIKRYQLDNNTLSELLRGNQVVIGRFRRVPHTDIFVSAIAVREAIRGVTDVIGANEKQGAKGLPGSYTFLIRLIESLRQYQIYLYTQEADALYKSWSGKGSGPGQNDWRIAASAVSAGMIIVTADRHFAKIQQFVPELVIEDWSQS